MTQLSSSRDVLGEFMAEYGKFRPIDGYVGAVPVRGDPGAYRITYAVRRSDIAAGTVQHTRDMRQEALEALPIQRGGLIGALIADGQPKMAHALPEITDPQLRPVVGMQSCMAIPIFGPEHIDEWTFAFSNVPDGAIQPRDVVNATVTANLLGSANRHIDMVGEIKRLNRALNDQIDAIARVQQSLLPSNLPRIRNLSIASSYLTSDAAGGDYYDFFRLPSDTGEWWGILIADVSGHGAAAATVMAMLHAILHCYEHTERGEPDPYRVMKYVNTRLAQAGLEGSFITAFFAVVDAESGRVRYCNCGHNPPRILKALTQQIIPVNQRATFPLGIFEDLPADGEGEFTLAANDMLVLYTDGITEAFNASREMFAERGIDQALLEGLPGPDEAVMSIHCGLFAHTASRSRADDQTIVVIQYLGQDSAA
jgi:sigma-B regulation protein RsbU (phosphoserine phosphatase)